MGHTGGIQYDRRKEAELSFPFRRNRASRRLTTIKPPEILLSGLFLFLCSDGGSLEPGERGYGPAKSLREGNGAEDRGDRVERVFGLEVVRGG